MKMNGLIFGGLFWGILISLIGLSIVLKYAFHIQLPLVRVFFGIIIILIGLKIIVGQASRHQAKSHNYSTIYHYSRDYDVVFSSTTIDLSKYESGQKIPGEISVVFGSAVVIVPDTMNLEVSSTTVFGTTIMPDRSYAGFGEDRYMIKNNPDAPVNRMETTTVFGKLVFEIVPGIKSGIGTEADSVKAEPVNSF